MHDELTLFRQEAVRHRRRRVHGEVFLSRPVSATCVTFALLAMTVAALAFLSVFEFQRRETVSGYVTSSSGVVTLRARNGGLLSELYVDVGDTVKAGDPLFTATTEIESTAGLTRGPQIAASDDALEELNKQLAMVGEAYAARRERLQHKRRSLRSRIEQSGEQVALNEQVLQLAEKGLERLRRLNRAQHASENEVTRQLEQVLQDRADVATLAQGVADAQSELRDVELELGGLRFAEARDLSDLKVRRHDLLRTRLEQSAQRNYLVRSPVSGRVSAIQGHVGQELAARAAVVTVLPEGARLVANLLAPSRAVGFLEVGGPVNLLIDAFPYQKFGVHRGRIRQIAKTAQRTGERPFNYDDATYKVVVELEPDYVVAYGQKYPLQVDMTLRGDLIVDRRSLLDWLLEPLRAVRL